jgi:DNA-binding transcriptional LysR family regulator
MEMRLLKMFCWVADSGSLAVAARKLHLTPSALSHGIKALETEVGCRLFERAGRRVLLNQAGEQLLEQVRAPLAALDAAGEALKKLGKWGKSRLRIGASASFCGHILPGVIRELRKSNPDLEFRVESGDTPELMDLVRSTRLDLAVGVAPPQQSGLEVRPLFRDELLFVLAPSHPWAAGLPITREELRKQPLILYRHSSFTARLTKEFFQDQDVAPNVMMEIGSIEAIKELVKLNLGVSILAPWTADRELSQGTLKMRPLGPRRLTRSWVTVSLAGRRLTLAEENFSKLCRRQSTGLRLDRRDVPSLRT